jgi:hypothetical protein
LNFFYVPQLEFPTMLRTTPRVFFIIMIVMLLAGSLVSACSSNATSPTETGGLAMASMDGMPAEVKSAPTAVQQAYQFNVANPDVMKQIPCYCGCGKMGHTSNYACYVQDVDEQGVIMYDTHALGCSICVDITQDVMRMLKQGKSVAEIKSSIDQTYVKYGPSNIP